MGTGAVVGADAWLDDCVLHPRAIVEEGARVVGSILGPGSRVGSRAVVRGSVLAEEASVAPGATLDGARVSAGRRASSGERSGPTQPMG